MKEIILDVLENFSQGQINLASEAARKTIANSIMAAIKSKGRYFRWDEKKLNKMKDEQNETK